MTMKVVGTTKKPSMGGKLAGKHNTGSSCSDYGKGKSKGKK